MSKRLTHDLVYEAPLADVRAMLADRAFREEVCEFQHVIRHAVTIESRGVGMDVRIDQHQAARGIPSFAKKFVGDEINIVQTETWSGESEAAIHVAIPHKPGDMTGTVRLRQSGGVTTETVDYTIKVHIPLVGGKIEGLISDLLLKALRAEHKVGRDYLSR